MTPTNKDAPSAQKVYNDFHQIEIKNVPHISIGSAKDGAMLYASAHLRAFIESVNIPTEGGVKDYVMRSLETYINEKLK